jgi:hypothetical protein
MGLLQILATIQEQILEKVSEVQIAREKEVETYMEMSEKEENGMNLMRMSEMRKVMQMSIVKGLGKLLDLTPLLLPGSLLQALQSWTLLLTEVENLLLRPLPPSLT